jgi:hypothetical protein
MAKVLRVLLLAHLERDVEAILTPDSEIVM